MKELLEIFREYASFKPQEMELIRKSIKYRKLAANDHLLNEGSYSRELVFLSSGIIRVALYLESGEDITRAFIPEYHFAVNFKSFFNHEPSKVNFIAVTDCELLVFDERTILKLSNEILGWHDFLLKISSKALSNKMHVLNNMLIQDAETRYKEFLKIYPGLANRVPLSTLASYIGINQASLSRIRKKIS
ncbi:Crp/Fnr family transcriptional regulator [Mucilaginibacter ximonensis]|uniref:Crp/Fnr family transcriptional regulator n=1 Tax=Mucilaginibacter ximonensis TaxID=538021 RepID=A0ABW5YAB5_9SPHI